MQAGSPALVIADTPYLAIEAGSRAQIPTVALASFTWDLVLKEYCHATDNSQQQLIQCIRDSYAKARHGPSHHPCSKNRCLLQHHRYRPDSQPRLPEREQLCLNPRPGAQRT